METRDEKGFRVSLVDSTFRFPNEETLQRAIEAVNALADNHALKPCPDGQECKICFFTRASAESKLFNKYVKGTMGALGLGPLGAALIDSTHYFAVLFFFFNLGQEIGRATGGDVEKEIDALNKMFGLSENKAPEDGQQATN